MKLDIIKNKLNNFIILDNEDKKVTEYINVNGVWEKFGSVDTVSSELSDLEASGDDIDLLF